MNINVENLVSISEANEKFSTIAQLVNEKGATIILKNNVPSYFSNAFMCFFKCEKLLHPH